MGMRIRNSIGKGCGAAMFGSALTIAAAVATPTDAFSAARGFCGDADCNLFLDGRITHDDVQVFRRHFEKLEVKAVFFSRLIAMAAISLRPLKLADWFAAGLNQSFSLP